MAWDNKSAKGEAWTQAALKALQEHGSDLPQMVPGDIDNYCPGYKTASMEDRQAFWAGLLSSMAKHESTWRETAVGGGGRWFGLVQIAPGTARAYGCEAKSGSALLDGSKNLSCAIRIMNKTVPRDGVISAGMRGVAADWGPFHSSKKRNDMMTWVSSQGYCQAQEAKG
ncbi:transglycosylase SLT domain-containing protein [Poseidonocella sp. HB161398]|uniref:transglycosylase SLT domain-containing protein n=1 Tax=Poseidonocella sp. HB161398 TaxID=2320855 RepID=UPI001F0FDF6D|nr:transglycosylase SLT domain-containing protein [Poseidonocella sp. HB161398]